MRAPVLKVDRDGPVTILTLNRPDALNSFDEELHHAFARFWLDLESDLSVRAVVLTGAGKAFCAGAASTTSICSGPIWEHERRSCAAPRGWSTTPRSTPRSPSASAVAAVDDAALATAQCSR